jgi:pilus assembly protein CpaB
MKRRVLSIVLAVLLAAIGTAAVLIYVNQADARALADQEAVVVLVAEKPVPAGTPVGTAKDSLRVETMPAYSVPSDVVSAVDGEINGLFTSTALAEGQLLTRGMLVDQPHPNDVALPEGKLAVTVPVEAGNQGDDQLKPGLQVAVFNTFTVLEGQDARIPSGDMLAMKHEYNHATRLLLARVEVIGVLAEKPPAKDGTPAQGFGKHLVTLAVTQPEAERLIHALNTGTVSLAEVNDESKVAPGNGVDNHDLFDGEG